MVEKGVGGGSNVEKGWKHPSAEAALIRAEEAIPWSEQIDKAEHGELVGRIVEDLRIVDDIEKEDFPTDEETCDKIGERHGIGAAEVAALSKLLHKKKGETTH